MYQLLNTVYKIFCSYYRRMSVDVINVLLLWDVQIRAGSCEHKFFGGYNGKKNHENDGW